jgi:hypothetical protein
MNQDQALEMLALLRSIDAHLAWIHNKLFTIWPAKPAGTFEDIEEDAEEEESFRLREDIGWHWR